jgi:type IV pilus biogenesis protein PilP
MNKGIIMKKNILAALVASIVLMGSGAVMAQVESSSAAKVVQALPKPAEVDPSAVTERPTATSNLSKEQRAMVNDFIGKNKEIVELAHREKVLALEARLSKLELEKTKAEMEKEKLTTDAISERAKESKAQADASEVKTSKAGIELDGALNHVYVTKIYGLDSQLKATVYYKGSIVSLQPGDQLPDGIRLVRIVKGGAIFSKGKEVRRVSMTTGYNAYANSFTEKNDEDKDESKGNQGMAMPPGFPAMASPMIQ